jgi:hypothetical protein
MAWISQNWVWVLFFIAFMAMHMFGHGGHGGHGGGGDSPRESKVGPKAAEQAAAEQRQGHQH